MKRKPLQDITSFGTATMGARGQVVIPAGIRKKLEIKAGEKFIVFLTPSKAAVFIPSDQFGRMVSELDKRLAKLRQLAR